MKDAFVCKNCKSENVKLVFDTSKAIKRLGAFSLVVAVFAFLFFVGGIISIIAIISLSPSSISDFEDLQEYLNNWSSVFIFCFLGLSFFSLLLIVKIFFCRTESCLMAVCLDCGKI